MGGVTAERGWWLVPPKSLTMGLINVRRRIIHTLCIVVAAGCATTARKPAPISFDLAVPSGLPAEVRTTGLDEADLLATYNEFMQHLYSTAPPRTLNILALSGGGAGGAFGAGALIGMTRRGDRPRIPMLTGLSLGAFIAPFAFPGSPWGGKFT